MKTQSKIFYIRKSVSHQTLKTAALIIVRFLPNHPWKKLTQTQGRRNRGGGRGGHAPSFAKCPFLAWKMSLRLHFFPKGHFWNLESMLFPENFFHFREKYHISGYMWYIRKIILVCPKKIFETTPSPPVANISGENNFRCPFYSKSAPQSLAPQTFTSFLRPCWQTVCV